MSRPVKGLLIKDLRLIVIQMKMFFAMLAVWGLIMSISVKGSFFLPGYAAVLCSFLSLSTYSYDEFDNGMAYIFTLPAKRRDYVRAKYLLGILLAVIPTIVVTVVSGIAHLVTKGAIAPMEYVISTLNAIAIAFVLMAVENPIYIKFGQEKSRIARMISIGMIAFCFGVIGVLYEDSANGRSVLNSIAGLEDWLLMLLMMAAALALMYVSYCISCVVLEKKQF